MDTIFRKTTSWLGVVKTAADEPRRYGKHGELLIAFEETEEHRRVEKDDGWTGHVENTVAKDA